MSAQTSFPSNDTVALATAIVERASVTARRFFRQSIAVEFKSDESPVTVADKTIESEIRTALTAAFPSFGILGEEHGLEGSEKTDIWVVDPIDGTRSFISGNPLFGMLLGLTRNQTPQLGIVAMPALEETYVGGPGLGARLNGEKISTSSCTSLENATVYINEAPRIFAGDEAAFRTLLNAGKTTRMAHDCYPHALLASGHVDCVVDYDLKPYDFLPVAALVQGAGGLMTDWDGKPLTQNSDGRTISAATPQLHREICDLLGGAC
ncbi:MAG TPA: inositol monophosphatase [Devosia sp.]|nr:inositol monophosphatase [Devosia sp.]